jgi:predicted nucleic acid-binding protein
MAGTTASKNQNPAQPGRPIMGVYIDSSALVKVYVPEPESDRLDRFLRGRRDLMISELAITEVISAVARRRREKTLKPKQANEIHNAILSDAESGLFRKQDMSPALHRAAERLLLSSASIPLRTLDALHIALALSAAASHLITFDDRLANAAVMHGLFLIEF